MFPSTPSDYLKKAYDKKCKFFDFCILKATPDGRVSKSVVKSDGPNKLIHEQRNPKTDSLVTVVTREVLNDKLVQTFVVGNVKCVRTFRRSQ